MVLICFLLVPPFSSALPGLTNTSRQVSHVERSRPITAYRLDAADGPHTASLRFAEEERVRKETVFAGGGGGGGGLPIAARPPVLLAAGYAGRVKADSSVPGPSGAPNREDGYPDGIDDVVDYNAIRQLIGRQAHSTVNRILAAIGAAVLLLLAVRRIVRRSKDEAVRMTQEAYIDEVNDMFTTIRGQRHDFLNHVQTIHTLLQLKKYDDLHRYTGELIGEIRQINDIIQIGHPAVAAIVQSKAVIAVDKKIDFRHEFAPIGALNLGATSVDIVTIIGNLVDNAFDEVMKLPVHKRWVELKGWHQGGSLLISVRNPGRMLNADERAKLFLSGYSTKDADFHSGIGLAVTKKRIDAYKGSITVESDEQRGTTFTVSMPLVRFGKSS